jgi:hypothetical protein
MRHLGHSAGGNIWDVEEAFDMVGDPRRLRGVVLGWGLDSRGQGVVLVGRWSPGARYQRDPLTQ